MIRKPETCECGSQMYLRGVVKFWACLDDDCPIQAAEYAEADRLIREDLLQRQALGVLLPEEAALLASL